MSVPTQITNLPPPPPPPPFPAKGSPSSDLLSDLVPRVLYYPSGRRENLGTRLLESLNDGDDNDNDNIAKAVGLTKTLHVCSTFFDTVSLPLLRGESRGLT